MDTREMNELQAVRHAVLAASPAAQAARVNALLTLVFRKIEGKDFTQDYYEYSFWPQLAPLLEPAQQAAIAACFAPLLQAPPA
ncbi:hypothetical protein [Lacticaseibacillus parakribbianus]|uniref:hypothetical protein n=1 Tax=Lacticaseibacillus parakribbianus TaxID=2970927 RepID=UPI0021CB1627|nr:hypothetical protein [Lacticaseibacillus parakribbianus]